MNIFFYKVGGRFPLIFSFLVLTLSLSFVSAELHIGYNDNGNAVSVSTFTYTGNISNFTELQDTPNSFAGEANKCVMVAGTEDGLVFANCVGAGVYVPYAGATGGVNLNGQSLTNVGALVVAGLATTQNLVPDTDNLYSIGNSTNRYNSLYANNIYGRTINSTNISSAYLNSSTIDSQNVTTGDANISNNLTIGGFKVNKQGTDLVITLE